MRLVRTYVKTRKGQIRLRKLSRASNILSNVNTNAQV